jgi:hypothetical protein
MPETSEELVQKLVVCSFITVLMVSARIYLVAESYKRTFEPVWHQDIVRMTMRYNIVFMHCHRQQTSF